MRIYEYPKKEQWAEIVERPHLDVSRLNATVAEVLADVKARGDEAVKAYELKFDHANLSVLAVSEAEMQEAEQLVSDELKKAISIAHHNIYKFHEAQRFQGEKVETIAGVTCWQKSVAIERVGLYIPGGTAPLFSTVLMLATPAKIAGCKEIVLCTPPNSEGSPYGRRKQGVQGWRRTSYRRNGLWNGKRTQGIQDIRSWQSVCDGCQAAGKSARCGH